MNLEEQRDSYYNLFITLEEQEMPRSVDYRLSESLDHMEEVLEERREDINSDCSGKVMTREDILLALQGCHLNCVVELDPTKDFSYDQIFNPDIQDEGDPECILYLPMPIELMLLKSFTIDFLEKKIYIDDYIFELEEDRDYKYYNEGYWIGFGERIK